MKKLLLFFVSIFVCSLNASQVSQKLKCEQKKIDSQLNELMWNYVENNKIQELAQLLEGPVIPQIDSARHGMSPLLEALFHHKYDIAKLLIGAGANPHKKDPYGENTALMYAIDNPDIVKLLLQAGADPFIGKTMEELMLRTDPNNPCELRLLISEGVDPKAILEIIEKIAKENDWDNAHVKQMIETIKQLTQERYNARPSARAA